MSEAISKSYRSMYLSQRFLGLVLVVILTQTRQFFTASAKNI